MKKLYFLAPTLLPAMALAHGGHGPWDPASFIHYIGTPVHALPLVAIALIGTFFLRRRLKSDHR